jgi:hypothetical protein
MWNIVIGGVFVWGGLSGNLALRGTNSGGALAAVGGVLIVWGVVQVVRARMQPANPSEPADHDAKSPAE